MSSSWSFVEGESLLKSSDVSVQSNAAKALFDEWFRLAVETVKGGLSHDSLLECTTGLVERLLRSDAPGFFTSSSSDGRVVETLLLHFRNVCTILSSKPKVYAMCFSQPKGQAFMKWLASFAVGTLQDALRAHTTDDVKVSVVQCLKALASVNVTMVSEEEGSPYKSPPLAFNIALLTRLAVQPALDLMLREAALACLTEVGKTSPLPVAISLAASAQDAAAFTPMWALGAMGNDKCVDVLAARLAKSRPAARMSSFDPLSELCTAVLSSLYDATVDARSNYDHWNTGVAYDERDRRRHRSSSSSSSLSAGAGSAPPASAATPSTPTVRRAIPAVQDDASEAGLCRVLAACELRETDTADVAERDHSLLQAYQAVLETAPNTSPLLLMQVLRHPTIATLTMLEQLATEFEPVTWLQYLLPFVGRCLASPTVEKEAEQEAVNVLREGMRLFYINSDRRPPTELGNAMFECLVKAMHAGYSETERFPELGARILTHHYGDGSLLWLEMALPACSKHAIMRSVVEMCMILVGLGSESMGLEPLASAATQELLASLSRSACVAGFYAWAELALASKQWLAGQQEHSVGVLLQHVDSCVDGVSHVSDDTLPLLTTVAELLRIVSLAVVPDHAPQLFVVSLKVSRLLPDERKHMVYSDESLARVVAKCDVLPLETIEAARAIVGPESRAALSLLSPFPFLLDADPPVRCAALQGVAAHLRLHTDLDTAVLVFASVKPVEDRADIDLRMHVLPRLRSDLARTLPPATPVDPVFAPVDDYKMNEVALTRAAAPSIAALVIGVSHAGYPAVVVRGILTSGVCRLLTAAHSTANTSIHSVADPGVVAAMDLVAACDPSAVESFVMSEQGRACLQDLAAVSAPWQSLLSTYLSNRRLRAVPVSGSRNRRNNLSSVMSSLASSVSGSASASSSNAQYELLPGLDSDLAGPADSSDAMMIPMVPLAVPSAPPIPHGASFAVGVPVAAPATTAVTNTADALYDALLQAVTAGKMTDALSISSRLRLSFPDAYARNGVGDVVKRQILPAVGESALPARRGRASDTAPASFSAEELGQYDRYVGIVRELQAVGGPDVEEVLGVTKLLSDMCVAVVKQTLDESGPAAARQWMSARGIHNPRAVALIDRHELAGTTADDNLMSSGYLALGAGATAGASAAAGDRAWAQLQAMQRREEAREAKEAEVVEGEARQERERLEPAPTAPASAPALANDGADELAALLPSVADLPPVVVPPHRVATHAARRRRDEDDAEEEREPVLA